MTAKRQALTPLIDIHNKVFAKQYELGVQWAMHGEEQGKGVYPDSYLVKNLKKDVEHGYFDNLDDYTRAHVGFYFGVIHGGILSPKTGLLRPEATMLITFTHKDSKRGYNAGRRAFFTELEPQETVFTDVQVIERFRELVEENKECFSPPNDYLIYWVIGDLLGILSGYAFPMTSREQKRWKNERIWWKAMITEKHAAQEQHDTEPLPVINTLQEA